jgi:hypothetical protein
MKYLVGYLLVLIVFILVLPILIIKWVMDGMDDLIEALGTICGIEEK